jgi:site-specific DNA-methyltransferase (adenine-specific)
MDMMSRYPDKYFDLAIVDPPYGIGVDKENISMALWPGKDKWRNRRATGYLSKGWDSKTPNADYFNGLFRVSNKQIIWGGHYFNLPPSGGWIVWDKNVKMPSLSKCELAWTSFLGHIEKYDFMWAGFRKGELIKRIHPTQKPVKLYKWILQNYAKPGWKILDTHGGSFSIAIACEEMGFDLTACEIDRDYYNAGMERIREYQRQCLFNF